MSEKILWIMSGVPASGKSTFIEKHMKETFVVSRDVIRFSMLEDADDYFAKEDEVFKTFIKEIHNAFHSHNQVVADATHLSVGSRTKLLDALNLPTGIEINIVFFDTPLSVCLERNEKREGRAKVPKGVIRRMFYQCQPPVQGENKYTYNNIYTISEKKGE